VDARVEPASEAIGAPNIRQDHCCRVVEGLTRTIAHIETSAASHDCIVTENQARRSALDGSRFGHCVDNASTQFADGGGSASARDRHRDGRMHARGRSVLSN